jgi:hypothetical protein
MNGGGESPERSEGTGVGVDLIHLSQKSIERISVFVKPIENQPPIKSLPIRV